MQAFNPVTIKKDKRLDVITSVCKVGFGTSKEKYQTEKSKLVYKEYTAVWDTGATKTTISQKIVDELGLKPIGKMWSSTANGFVLVDTYPISVLLPNNIVFFYLAAPCNNMGETEMLIGMDIISQGDFSITNVDGKTTFSFRIPSIKEIDYEKELKELQQPTKPIVKEKKPGRNDPCPCGSGKKFKNCCGK